jgi:hypothetical protein
MQRRRTQRGGGGLLNGIRRAFGGSPKLTPAAELLVKQRKERLEFSTKKEGAKKTLEAKISKANPLYNKFYTRIEAAETLEELHICVEFLNKTVFALELLFENRDNLSELRQTTIKNRIDNADNTEYLDIWIVLLQDIKQIKNMLDSAELPPEEYGRYVKSLDVDNPEDLKLAIKLIGDTFEARRLAPPKAGGRRSRRRRQRRY